MSFVIEVSEESGAFSELPSVLSGTNQYLHLLLTGGNSYTYRIKAVNKYGEATDFSDETVMLTG